MGKAKRFNVYDGDVANQRKLVEGFGQQRQKLSIGSAFRSSPLSPPIAVSTGADAGTGTGTFCSASIASDQTTNISTNNHVEFDTLDEDNGIVLQTGSGQSDGIFELSGGKKYYLSGVVRPEFSGATGQLVMVWYDITNAAEIGKRAIYESQTNTSDNGNQPLAQITFTPDVNVTVEFRIISVTALTALANEYCQATIFEISLGASSGGSGGGTGGVSFPITPTINDHGNVGTITEDIDISTSTGHVHKITLTGDPTLTFSNPPTSGTQMEFEIEFVQDATGNRVVTHPATVAETVTISPVANATTIVTYRTNDGGTTYHAIPALRGSISLGGSANFANTALSNLATPVLNTVINFNSKAPTGFNGYVSQVVGNTLVNDTNGATWTLPTGDEYLYNINGVAEFSVSAGNINLKSNGMTNYIGYTGLTGQTSVLSSSGHAWTLPTGDTYKFTINAIDQFEIKENNIDTHSHAFTNYIGFTGLVGQADVFDATGVVHSMPIGDTYTWNVGGVSKFVVSSAGNAMNGGNLNMNSNKIVNVTDPASNQDAATKLYVDNNAGSPPFDDNQVIIQDEVDNTKTLTFNLSLVSGSAVNLLSWASGGSRTHTFSSTTGTLAQANTVQSWSAIQTFEDGKIKIGDSGASNTVLLQVEGLTSDVTATLPNNTGTIAEINLAQTWTNTQTYSNQVIFNGDVTVNEDITFGSSNADIVVFTSKINSNVPIVGGNVVKSNDTTEIGLQVTNASISIGTAGTLQIPYKTGSASSAAQADTDFGDEVGCMGVYLQSAGNPILCIREVDGSWATEILTGNGLT